MIVTTFYDQRPGELSFITRDLLAFRTDIEEHEVPTEGGEAHTQYSAHEIRINAPFSQNKLIEATMVALYGNDFENKLINEYNSANLGLYDQETAAAKIAAYNAFLAHRIALKTRIEQLLTANNIA